MSNNLNPVATGQLFLPSAAVWNRMQNGALQAEQAKLDAGQKTAKSDLPPSGGWVLVKNATGSPVPQFGVLAMSGPLTLPTDNLVEFRSRVVVAGHTANGFTGSKFCVLAEPLGPTQVGRAFVSGIIPVKINVTNASHKYAIPDFTPDAMVSNTTGAARIVWKESGTGVVWALIEKAVSPEGDEGDNPGGTGGSGCCCAESKCLKIAGYTSPITPQWYEFEMPGFLCNCDPATDAGKKVKLLPTSDPLIWESAPFQCYGTDQQVVPCTVTANWVWVLDTCENDCEYQSEPDWSHAIHPGSPRTWGYEDVPGSHYTAGAPVADNCLAPDCGCDADALAAAAAPTAEGQSLFTDCVSTGAGGHWELVSVDDEDCNCTPLPPSYSPEWDGTGDAPTDTTTCDGFKTVDATGTLLDAFHRLTIAATRDYYGCDLTKVEFIIGVVVIFTYYLQDRCGVARGFCRDCVNTFRIQQCGPTQCDADPPPVICLTPVIPTDICEACGFPIAMEVQGLIAPGDTAPWSGSWLLPPVVNSGCSWYVQLPRIVITGDTTIPLCGATIFGFEGVFTGNLLIVATLVSGTEWSYKLTHGWALVMRATEDVPLCGVEVGDIVGTASLSVDSDTVSFDPANCTDDFTFELELVPGVPITLTIKIHDLTPLVP